MGFTVRRSISTMYNIYKIKERGILFHVDDGNILY